MPDRSASLRHDRPAGLVVLALGFALLVPALGDIYIGSFYAAIFLLGYVGGFLMWFLCRRRATWHDVQWPYWLTLIAFVLHKIEENRTRFFEAVSERITGTPVPEVNIGLMLSLLVVPVVAWLIVPWLMKRGNDFGVFLAWTFFASMGLTELAHFGMPAMAREAYGYFPGMATAVLVAPLGWWGMVRLWRGE